LLQPVLRRPAKGLFQADRHFCGYFGFAIDLDQAYIDTYMDKDGAAPDGAETYRSCVAGNAPPRTSSASQLRREHSRLDRQ
jgi:hypothetical protein